MALEQKLSLKLSQKLVMTPSLQQAIKLLQMTRLELQGVLSQELVENPILEEGSDANDETPEAEETAEAENAENAETDDNSMENIDLDAYFSDYMEGSSYASMSEVRQAAPLENTVSRDPDLYDHLLWQLHMLSVPPRQREIAEAIIGNLEGDGFLAASCREIQGLAEGEDPYRVEEVIEALKLVRRFEPPGIACRDLRESLVCQLDLHFGLEPPMDLAGFGEEAREEERGPVDGAEVFEATDGEAFPLHVEDPLPCLPGDDEGGKDAEGAEDAEDLEALLELEGLPEAYHIARSILCDYWQLFLKRQYPTIASRMDLSMEALRPGVELIRSLDPRPGRRFNSERPYYIEPDVEVVKLGGEYVIQVNDDGMPRLRISGAYRQMLRHMKGDRSQVDARQYIKEKMRSALWLIKSLDQRQRTIYKVANSIVLQQQLFLEKGIDHLRPMVLRDVADDIGMHESTVSRVVANKYINTPRGLFPLKFFFHSGIDREYGENISSLTVKRKIEHLVKEEDEKKPLSDSELMRILKREGIQIARRTVAKYRDELNIPSSTDRKKHF